MALHHILKDLQRAANPKKAKGYQNFFKADYTNPKDRFIGVALPEQRKIAKRHPEVSYKDILTLLKSNIHEYRMLAAILLTERFKKREFERKIIYDFYMKHKARFYNWDLVDVSCDKIVGGYLLDKKKERKVLYDLAKSESLWDRRISIISTFEFIRNNDFEDTLKLAKIHLKDGHDLMHKATGWMLREVGKRDKNSLLKFLKENYKNIPRTTLRYAIEKFSEEKRKQLLQGEF